MDGILGFSLSPSVLICSGRVAHSSLLQPSPGGRDSDRRDFPQLVCFSYITCGLKRTEQASP